MASIFCGSLTEALRGPIASGHLNGTSIVRETRIPDIFVYYHIELDVHALIQANNVPSETFVDNVDRIGFDNWQEHETLYPDGRPIAEMPYPRVKSHRQLPRSIREHLAKRAAILAGESQRIVA